MSDLQLNGQPLSKLVYNVDNFQRLKAAYEEAMDLVVKLNAKLSVADDKPVEKKTRAKKSK